MTNKNLEYSLKAISPIDGRYANQIDDELKDINSEYGLIKKRLFVEIKWFIFLTTIKSIKNQFNLNNSEKNFLLNIYNNFTIKDAIKIKEIEEITNHDVKSIEYFLQKNLIDIKH